MAIDLFEWRSKGKDFPVGAVFFHPRNGVLMVLFKSEDQVTGWLPKLQAFDAKAYPFELEVVISKGKDPLRLGEHLLKESMIGRDCYDEMKRELEEYKRRRGSNEPDLPGH